MLVRSRKVQQRRLTIAVLMGVAFVLSIATARSISEEGRAAREELRSRIQDFVQQAVHPQLDAWKVKIDAALSPDDLAALNDLRGRAQALKEFIHAKREAARDARHNGDDASAEALRDEIIVKHAVVRSILKELRPIAENNRELLMEIGEEARPLVQQWRESTGAILDQWQAEYADLIERAGPRAQRRLEKFRERLDGKSGERRKHGHAARILLWNGSASGDQFHILRPRRLPESDGASGGSLYKMPSQEPFGHGSKVYPNPAHGSAKIAFSLYRNEPVTLSILDQSGRTLAKLIDERKDAGDHMAEFNPSELGLSASGVYYYQLTTPSHSETKPLVFMR